MHWESLVGRIIAIMILGTLLVLLGSHLWNPSFQVAQFEACSLNVHRVCAVAGGDPLPHIELVAVLGVIWVATSFFIIRNRDR